MNGLPVEIRLAESGDAHSIAELSAQWGYDSPYEKIKSLLDKILHHKDHVVFVLFHENRMAGWIHGIYSLRVESDPFVEIGGLVVDRHFRRLGFGKLLVNKTVDWCLHRNCHSIRVRCNIIRTEANAFYSMIGFKEIKQQKIYDMKV